MKIGVKVQRTEMCGGGTSYDVLWPVAEKAYHPIAGNCYATTIHPWWEHYGQTRGYFRTADFLRTPELDALPYSNERCEAFDANERVAERLEARIAARAFEELAGCRRIPSLWIRETYPSDVRTITVDLSRHCHITEGVCDV